MRPARHTALQRAVLLTLPLLLAAVPLAAQAPAPATSYHVYYDQLREVRPTDQSAPVSNFSLRRDDAEFLLQDGRIWLLGPVNGRTMAIGFEGSGVFRYTPSSVMEQERLQEMKKVSAMDQRFTEMIVLFGDGTLDELKAKLSFTAGPDNDRLRSRFREAVSYLGEEDEKAIDPDLMLTLLNGDRNDLFYAHMAGRGDPWIYMINPHEVEGVRLLGRPRGVGWVRFAEVVTQTRRTGEDPYTLDEERTPEPAIHHYAIESWMSQDITGGLKFAARASMAIRSDSAAGPWVAFQMYHELKADSARLGSGERLEVFKADDHNAVYVRLNRRPRRVRAPRSISSTTAT